MKNWTLTKSQVELKQKNINLREGKARIFSLTLTQNTHTVGLSLHLFKTPILSVETCVLLCGLEEN